MTFHLQQGLQRGMAQLIELIKSKSKPISSDQLAGIMKIYFSQLEDVDLYAMIDVYVPRQTELSVPESLEIAEVLIREVKKLQPLTNDLAHFYCNSLLKLENSKIVIKEVDLPTQLGLRCEFKDILSENLYKKLINYGLSGLLFMKFQDKPHRRYSFFQWVEYNLDLGINEETDNLYLTLLKQVWSFKFNEMMDTLTKIKVTYPSDKEVSSMEVGLKIFQDIYSAMTKNQELKDKFIDRKHFAIDLEDDHYNKKQEKQFNNKINEIKQQLMFGSNYFLFIKDSFKNKFYYAIALFLGNREDNFVKEHDKTIRIEEISIVDRFFYAKKFFRNQDFEALKKQMLDGYMTIYKLDYIILFGARKESEQILQNYIDQTNDIEKVAVICVVLKILVEAAKSYPKDSKVAFYSRFIRLYEFLLESIDSGISKHNFGKKCIAIEVQNKKKTMNKTFDINCINCGTKQCLLSVSKRIDADSKKTHVHMKGHNIFSKDPRNQVSYCLDCMQLLPKCAVCLYQVTVYNGYAEQAKKNNPDLKNKRNNGQNLQNAMVWCPKCFHGGHFSHIMRWMALSEKKKCPVYSCKCKCQI